MNGRITLSLEMCEVSETLNFDGLFRFRSGFRSPGVLSAFSVFKRILRVPIISFPLIKKLWYLELQSKPFGM